MGITPGAPGRAPTFEFDPQSPFAALDMFALATWPNDPGRQEQFRTAHFMQVREHLRAAPPHLNAADLKRYSGEMDPSAAAQAGRDELRRDIETRLDAANGWTTILESPPVATLRREIVDASGGPPRLAGQVLLLIACMEEHHKDLPPSINRAMAVLESRYAETLSVSGVKERTLGDTWREHRRIAHLWAAIELHQAIVQGWDLKPAAAFMDPAHRYVVLGAAGWFREFATTYRPKRAREELVPEMEAIEIKVGIDATKPTLPALPDKMLDVARSYSVKAVKHGY